MTECEVKRCFKEKHYHRKVKNGAARRIAEGKGQKKRRKAPTYVCCQYLIATACAEEHFHNGDVRLHVCEDLLMDEQVRSAAEFKDESPTPFQGRQSACALPVVPCYVNPERLVVSGDEPDLEDVMSSPDPASSSSTQTEEEEEEDDESDEGEEDEGDDGAVDEGDVEPDEGDDENDPVASSSDEEFEETRQVTIFTHHLETAPARLPFRQYPRKLIFAFLVSLGLAVDTQYAENQMAVTEVQHGITQSNWGRVALPWPFDFISISQPAYQATRSNVFYKIYPHQYQAEIFIDIADEAQADSAIRSIQAVRGNHEVNPNLALAVNYFIQNHQNASYLLMPQHQRLLLDTVNFIVNRRVLDGCLRIAAYNPHHTQQPLNCCYGHSLGLHPPDGPCSSGIQLLAWWRKSSPTMTLSLLLRGATFFETVKFCSRNVVRFLNAADTGVSSALLWRILASYMKFLMRTFVLRCADSLLHVAMG